jgi:hypothetical protein
MQRIIAEHDFRSARSCVADLTSEIAPKAMLEHFPAKHALGLDPGVGTGSPQKTRPLKANLERIPIPLDRNSLLSFRGALNADTLPSNARILT